jgi:CRP/FNR family transcriptional regulator, cyclic AMP receptor protein
MERTSLEELLAEDEFFGTLGDADLGTVAGCGRLERFSAGDHLFLAGEPADRFYLIRQGRVALDLHAAERGVVTIDTVEPGEIAGISWLFPPYRWQFDARASEPVAAVGFDAACLRAKAESEPRLGYELMKRFASLLLQRMQSARLRLLDLYDHAGPR